MQNDKELLLDQQIGLCFLDVNRMQETQSHHQGLVTTYTAHSSVAVTESSDSNYDSLITKNSPIIRSTSEQDQNMIMNQIVAKFHQDYRRVSSDIEAPQSIAKPSLDKYETYELVKSKTCQGADRDRNTLSLENVTESVPLLLSNKTAMSSSLYNNQQVA